MSENRAFTFLKSHKRFPLTRVGVANFLSFGEKGFLLDGLRRVNLFIGKNNAGKSNVLQAIELFSQLPANGWLKPPLSDHQNNKVNPSFLARVDYRYYLDPKHLDPKQVPNRHVKYICDKFPDGPTLEFGWERPQEISGRRILAAFEKAGPEPNSVFHFTGIATGAGLKMEPRTTKC